MKAVLISIQPIWCEKIANGQKTIEVRKTRPKMETPFKVYICHTKTRNAGGDDWNHWADCWQLPIGKFVNAGGKVIGEFVCDGIITWYFKNDKYFIFYDDLQSSCLTKEEFYNYGKGNTFYGWHISDLKIYDKPKELGEFRKPCPTKEKGDCLSCDCLADNDYGGICTNNLTRLPQNWCYVEELE